MDAVTLDTQRLRYLLSSRGEQGADYRICAAYDIAGPGGGVYITAQTELDEHHLSWLERRNPHPQSGTFVDVLFLRGPAAAPLPCPRTVADGLQQPAIQQRGSQRGRAELLAREVRTRAVEVARGGEALHQALSRGPAVGVGLEREGSEAAVHEFEFRVRSFHVAVRRAIDEYLQGNTLVMDLIARFQLDKKEVRHALQVAALACELTVQLALRQPAGGDGLQAYFDGSSRAEFLDLAQEQETAAEDRPEKGSDEVCMGLFRRELAEIFLGGFMHDCGLWTQHAGLDTKHESKGAHLVWHLEELRTAAPSLVKIVLFHSDAVRLADRYGVITITPLPRHPGASMIDRAFYHSGQEACAAAKQRGTDARVSVLTAEDLRKVVPVALAERYITQLQDVPARLHWEIINDLARHVAGGVFMRYLVVLCNSQIHIVAPRRAYVRLQGTVPVPMAGKRASRRTQRQDMTDFEAASLGCLGDRNSPHLVTLFVRDAKGSRTRATYVDARDSALWDRSSGPYGRMYIPAGRMRNSLSLRVTGFLGAELYSRVLGEYEREFSVRVLG